jgi:hypothetical protein
VSVKIILALILFLLAQYSVNGVMNSIRYIIRSDPTLSLSDCIGGIICNGVTWGLIVASMKEITMKDWAVMTIAERKFYFDFHNKIIDRIKSKKVVGMYSSDDDADDESNCIIDDPPKTKT